jgi:hypothetical protein
MFGDYGRELLRSGILDAKAGNKESAAILTALFMPATITMYLRKRGSG